MKEEIAAGIKNALERGSSLEEAINSFINAGYNPAEVREASQMVAGGAISIVSSQFLAPAPTAELPQPPPAVAAAPKKTKAQHWKIIAIIVLLILIGIGLIGMIFSEQILNLLK